MVTAVTAMARRERSGSPKNQPLGEDSIRLRGAAHPSRYPWPSRLAALLGRTTDAALAKRADLSRKTVEIERRRRGIPAFTEKRPPVKWTRRLIAILGTASDSDIAEEMGVNAHTVNMKRRMLSIEPYGRPHPMTYEWKERGLALLGRKSDTEVGRALGISRNTVRVKRRELGIAARGKGPVRWTRAMKRTSGICRTRKSDGDSVSATRRLRPSARVWGSVLTGGAASRSHAGRS